jgi:twitching motility protein PilU
MYSDRQIRDREIMQYAISFSETGHLCLSTLHAISTNQALDRIINFPLKSVALRC